MDASPPTYQHAYNGDSTNNANQGYVVEEQDPHEHTSASLSPTSTAPTQLSDTGTQSLERGNPLPRQAGLAQAVDELGRAYEASRLTRRLMLDGIVRQVLELTEDDADW
jgi:hypothetical protein